MSAQAAADGASWRLSGRKDCVLSGDVADAFLVAARTPENAVELFSVGAAGQGVTVIPQLVLDPSRPQASVVLDGAVGRRLGAPGTGERVISRLGNVGALALSAELLGVMRTAFSATVGYVKTREQFSRPIGSFQAVKHICSNMYVELESARVTTAYA